MVIQASFQRHSVSRRFALLGACALVAVLALTSPASARQTPNPSVTTYDTNDMSSNGAMPDNEQVWHDQYAERQDIREARLELRHEHEELEAEHDSLKIECLDAAGQQRGMCAEKWQNWHMREEALMQRIRELHARAGIDTRHMYHKECTPMASGMTDKHCPPAAAPMAVTPTGAPMNGLPVTTPHDSNANIGDVARPAMPMDMPPPPAPPHMHQAM